MDQSVLKEILSANVGKILAHKTEADLKIIVDFLLTEGVKKESDLRHLTISMLKKVVDTIDASDLYVNWQNRFGASAPSTSTSSATIRQPLQERNLQSAAVELRGNRLPIFDIESPYFPSRVKEAIKKSKRPKPCDRQEMVDRIVDHCREKVPDLARGDFVSVAKQIVKLYEASFKDSLPVSETGHDSLAYQLQTKFDNDNRWLKKSQAEKNRRELVRPEAFGCTQWHGDIPNGETEASLERKKNHLIEIAGNTRRHFDWRQISPDMQATYCLQRRDINGPDQPVQAPKSKRKKRRAGDDDATEELTDHSESKKTIQELKTDWPFLFYSRGMNDHFKQLTGINFSQKVEDFLKEDGRMLINFLSLKGEKCESIRRKMDKYESRGHSSSSLIALVRLMQEYFKEPLKALVSYVEDTVEFDEVLDTATLPEDGTPFLVVAGDSMYDCNAIYFVLDSTVLASTANFLEAFVMWFTSFYVFNLSYATPLASSLIYIQKTIAEINTKGLKCTTTAIQGSASKKANKLSDQFLVYKEKVNDENERNVD